MFSARQSQMVRARDNYTNSSRRVVVSYARIRDMQTTSQDALKLAAAQEALKYLLPGRVLGVGSGSTVKIFIALLKDIANRIPGAVAASESSASALRDIGIAVLDANSVSDLAVYIDGADEVDENLMLIKGGGAALTREKILASAARLFVCMVDQSKRVERLGKFPLPIEVIPMATQLICRRVMLLGGVPTIRAGVATDNGNSIIDVTGLSFVDPIALETALNQLPGAVCNGVFALRRADVCISAGAGGVSVQSA